LLPAWFRGIRSSYNIFFSVQYFYIFYKYFVCLSLMMCVVFYIELSCILGLLYTGGLISINFLLFLFIWYLFCVCMFTLNIVVFTIRRLLWCRRLRFRTINDPHCKFIYHFVYFFPSLYTIVCMGVCECLCVFTEQRSLFPNFSLWIADEATIQLATNTFNGAWNSFITSSVLLKPLCSACSRSRKWSLRRFSWSISSSISFDRIDLC